jgi:hypothetical protein
VNSGAVAAIFIATLFTGLRHWMSEPSVSIVRSFSAPSCAAMPPP